MVLGDASNAQLKGQLSENSTVIITAAPSDISQRFI